MSEEPGQSVRASLTEETRREVIVVHGVDGDAEYVASHDPELQARRLVEMGLTEPWAAELHLEFERRHPDRQLAACFENPERDPPE
jgi:hypothetical protein